MQYSKPDFSTLSLRYDKNMRVYMVQLYNYMAAALVLTGIVAMLTISSETMMSVLYVMQNKQIIGFSPIGWIVSVAPLAIALAFSLGLPKMNVTLAQLLFWTYAILLGLSLSSVFIIYTGESIANIFFITASIFIAMSIVGYVTKVDLTSFGSFLFMGLIGILVTSIVNIFLKSSGLYFALSAMSVLIFTGLTAFDTQRIKAIYNIYEISDRKTAIKISILGALILYLDFINIFLYLLQLFGKKKEE